MWRVTAKTPYHYNIWNPMRAITLLRNARKHSEAKTADSILSKRLDCESRIGFTLGTCEITTRSYVVTSILGWDSEAAYLYRLLHSPSLLPTYFVHQATFKITVLPNYIFLSGNSVNQCTINKQLVFFMLIFIFILYTSIYSGQFYLKINYTFV